MRGIFWFYFRRNLPWAGLVLAVSLLSIPMLSRFYLLQDPDILLFFWVSIILPAACLLLGAATGAETASETASGAETVLPVSGFSRLAGAALSAVVIGALISAVLLAVSGSLKGGASYIHGGFNTATTTYLLTMLQACIFAFVFGRLSGSVLAGAVAGGGLALLTTSGILSSIAVDSLIIYDGRTAPVKIAMLAFSAVCGLLSLKYISELHDRKARAGFRNAGAAALLLAAGLIAAGLMLASSKSRAERILAPASAGDPSFAGASVYEPVQPYGYTLYTNPVKEAVLLLGPEGRLEKLMDGKTKSYAEFFSNPLRYIVRAHLTGENGETWALLREDGTKLFYAGPGGRLAPAAELGFKDLRYATMFRIGAKAYIGMRGSPDTMHYLAELVPGAKTLKWELLGSDSAEAGRAITKMRKASGTAAWLSADGMKLLRMSGGRETELCRLPYKGAAFYHTPVYKAVKAGDRELFFLPLRKDGRPSLYFCEKGKAARPAWNAPNDFMFKFTRNGDGSVFTSTTRRVDGQDRNRMFYALTGTGEFQPPIDADKAFSGLNFTAAEPVKAAGNETFFVLDHGKLVKLTGGTKPEIIAAWDTPVMTWRSVRDGVVYINKAGAFLVSWKGEKRRLN